MIIQQRRELCTRGVLHLKRPLPPSGRENPVEIRAGLPSGRYWLRTGARSGWGFRRGLSELPRRKICEQHRAVRVRGENVWKNSEFSRHEPIFALVDTLARGCDAIVFAIRSIPVRAAKTENCGEIFNRLDLSFRLLGTCATVNDYESSACTYFICRETAINRADRVIAECAGAVFDDGR